MRPGFALCIVYNYFIDIIDKNRIDKATSKFD